MTDEAVRQIIKRELRGSSAGHGYRLMWYKLKITYGIQVRRSTVMRILREEDPGRSLENLGILNEGFTHATVQTTLGQTQTTWVSYTWLRRWILEKGFMAQSDKK